MRSGHLTFLVLSEPEGPERPSPRRGQEAHSSGHRATVRCARQHATAAGKNCEYGPTNDREAAVDCQGACR